jgi:all-trans-retinol 13,14-reductase
LGLTGTNLWIHPDFNYEANLVRSAADVEAPLPFLYVSFPSAKDPDFERRHPGRATVEVIAPAPYAWFAQWQDTAWQRRGEAYEALKQRLSQRLQAGLVQRVPVLAGQIDYTELSTPLSTRHFANHAAGETYGLSSTPARFRLRELVPRSPLRHLYFTGQDISTLGIAGALVGGALTASYILRRNLL